MPSKPTCPDCDGVSRRDFLKGVSGAVAASAAAGLPVFATARAEAAPASKEESLVAKLYESFTPAQKSAVCFGWDDPKRLMIANNWHIVPQTIHNFYTPEQQEMIRGIFNEAHANEEWVKLRLQQLDQDAGGIGAYNIAVFGQPGTGKFEWVMTGRHLTLRLDGDSEPGVAFGGPVFYGHDPMGDGTEKPDHPQNVYWYQGKRANEVFKALDGKQREKALVAGAVPQESPKGLVVQPKEQRPGIPVAEMSRDQRELVGKVLEDLLAPFRKKDADEARRFIQGAGGVESLNMAFYSKDDLGNDGTWDVWRLEGPGMTWYFRGHPHVHTWVYVHDGSKGNVVYPAPR